MAKTVRNTTAAVLLSASSLLLYAWLNSADAQTFSTGDSYGPRDPSGVTVQTHDGDEQTETNRRYNESVRERFNQTGGCEADILSHSVAEACWQRDVVGDHTSTVVRRQLGASDGGE